MTEHEQPRPAGEKLQKVLARLGLASRREIETWIAEGRVKVNGADATLGQRVVFADAAQSGRLAGEIDRQSPAAREVAALTDEIARLGIGRVGQ